MGGVKVLKDQFAGSAMAARVLPFVIFVLLTSGQGMFGEASRYWIYAAKTAAGAWLIWLMRPYVAEMKWAISWEAVVVGVAVFGVWVGLDEAYPQPASTDKPWNPHAQFGVGSALAWLVIGIRIAGSSLVVPPLEEVFYRSFLYRYVTRQDFMSVPVGYFRWVPFLVTSVIFALAHADRWLAGLLCGLAYQALVSWKHRLGDAMTAHAITNLLLGIYVVYRGAWQFW